MSPVNPTLNTPSFGLYRLNYKAFEEMCCFHHRVWSVEPLSEIRFKVKTRCTNENNGGREPCTGDFQFKLTKQGPVLELGKLNHNYRCPKVELVHGTKKILQDMPCTDPVFRTYVYDYITNANEFAERHLKIQTAKRVALVEEACKENFAIPDTCFEVHEATTLKNEIWELNSLIAEYYLSH